MNIIRKLIGKIVALFISIIISLVICGTLFAVSEILAPNKVHYDFQLFYAGGMAIFMILNIYDFWDLGISKIFRSIEIAFFFIAYLTVVFSGIIIMLFVFSRLLSQNYSLPAIPTVPPILFIVLILACIAYLDLRRDKSFVFFKIPYYVYLSSKSSSKSSSWAPPKDGRTTHYDKNGNFKGDSLNYSDGRTAHYDKNGNFKGESWERK
jgi:hypothetical protein